MNKNIFIKEITVHNKPLIITNAVEFYISKHPKSAGYLLLSGAFGRNIRLAIRHLESITSQGVIIHDISDNALKELLEQEFVSIEASGGLVTNPNNDLLMIFRRGFWDLPKGKIDAGENEEEAAIREVKEETGLDFLEIEKFLTNTYHYYEQGGKKILKKTYWYKMTTPSTSTLTPQIEEDIMIAKWVKPNEATILIKSTYNTIQHLIQKYYL